VSTVSKGATKSKYGDLSSRLWFLLGALVVFRIGAHIPVPGIDPTVLADLFKTQKSGILGMFNMFSGGALSRFTIFALGIMPYISASIIMQLAAIAVPHLEQLKKEGEAGRRKITQYTRYGTLGLALFQAFGISVALQTQHGLVLNPGSMFQLTTIVTLVTGTMFLMWLGEQITERGLGNGISLIIFAGIAAGLPRAIGSTLELVFWCRCGYRIGGFCRTRATQDFGELRQTPSRQQSVWWAKFAFAAEVEYGWCDPADFCVQYYFIPGYDCGMVWQRAGHGLAEGHQR
jgi:preprotein translocase subunit SecY